MLELGRHFDGWAPARDGEDLVVATIVATSGSTPRPAGTSMLVAAGGGILGSLSGGCVEGAVVAAAQEVLSGGGARRERFGYSAEDAFAVGLTCGGELEIHLSRLSEPERKALASAPVALLRRLDDDGAPAVTLAAPSSGAGIAREAWVGLLGLEGAPEPIQEELLARARTQVEPLLRQGRSGLVRVAPPEGCHDGEAGTRPLELFVESRLPAPRAVVVGANDFSEALLPVLKLLGFHVTLCDARPGFAAQARFAPADSVERTWPHRYLERQAGEGLLDERSVLFVLSHDPKFDVPLLLTSLRLDLAYVGALGSRRSDRQRRASLAEQGLEPGLLDRLHSPIGLDLGAVTPAEVAVSIAAELVGVLHGAPGTAGSLSRGSGPLHHGPPH